MPTDFSPEFLRVMTALAKLVILSMLLERSLAVLFDYRWLRPISGYGLKVPIAILTSWIICYSYQFDILSQLFEPNQVTALGLFMTALIIAGGSAGAITLFQSIFKFSRDAQQQLKLVRQEELSARQQSAKAEKLQAEMKISSLQNN